MAEYIKQEAAVKAFENTKGHDFGFDLTDIKRIINSVPAADIAPVVHGRWSMLEWCGKNQRVCSNCYSTVKHPFFIFGEIVLYPYCPYCGAKMDLEG